MKSFINKIFNISFFNNKEIVQEEQEEQEEECSYESGQISIKFDAEDGSFLVESDIKDLSDKSAEVLSFIILHISEGNLNSFISNSIEEWASDDEERLIYNQKIALCLENLNDISRNDKNKVAVNASMVFNFKDMK
jgi:hypothetical protein